MTARRYGSDYIPVTASESHHHGDLRRDIAWLFAELAETQQQVIDLKREVHDLAEQASTAGVRS
jgi:hypothetical protein